jgi:hypothetical protein
LLQALHVQRLEFDPTVVKLSKCRELIKAGMGRCVVIALKASFSDNTKGRLSFSHSKEYDIFLFVINVNENLFTNDSQTSKVERKTVGVHEFVHCASALLLL